MRGKCLRQAECMSELTECRVRVVGSHMVQVAKGDASVRNTSFSDLCASVALLFLW